jgi:hypothetical protein
MPAGQLQYVTANPAQLLNPFSTEVGPTLIENLLADPQTGESNAFSIDLSWKPFPGNLPNSQSGSTSIYTLPAGASYAWPADIPLFARISPIQLPNGNSAPVWIQPQGVGQSSPFTTSILSGVDPAVLPLPVLVTNPPGSATLSVTLETPGEQEFTPANPQLGKSVGYIIPTAGKIKIFTGNLVCGAETNERLLYFQILFSPTGVIPFQFIIGQTTQSITFVGAPRITSGILGSILNFRLPDIFLPAGSRLAVNVIGLNPDDYLDDIDFVLSAA